MKNWKERLRAGAGSPITPRTLAEIYGTDRLLVEQHRGVLGYGTECIRIAATYGVLEVQGEQLQLCCMSRSQLVIRGRILCVQIGREP